MKKLSILTMCLLAPLVLSTSEAFSHSCPQKKVADLNQVCIEPIYIEGCSTYKSYKECDECSQFFEKVNGKCRLPDDVALPEDFILGCLVRDGSKCKNCANGFSLTEGTCKKGVLNCEEYSRNLQSCERCSSEYSLIFNECRHNHILGCRQETPDHRCEDCFSPFEINNHFCTIPNCKTVNDFGCLTCECNYFINRNNNCEKMAPGCLKYSRQTCIECLPHYRLKGGVCEIEGCDKTEKGKCTTCAEGYGLLESGICKLDNCRDWLDMQCIECDSNYHLKSGRCETIEAPYVCKG